MGWRWFFTPTRKRLHSLANGDKPNGPAWQNLAEHVNRDGARFRINEYFAANPHMMLGDMANAGTMYRSNEPTLVADGRDLATALREAISALPEGIYRAEENNLTARVIANPILPPDDVKENAFTLHDGGIAIRTDSMTNSPDECALKPLNSSTTSGPISTVPVESSDLREKKVVARIEIVARSLHRRRLGPLPNRQRHGLARGRFHAGFVFDNPNEGRVRLRRELHHLTTLRQNHSACRNSPMPIGSFRSARRRPDPC
jgi:hypothetical protein